MSSNNEQDQPEDSLLDGEKIDSEPQEEQTFLSHLFEVRTRLLHIVLVVLVIFLALFSYAEELYGWLAQPLLRYLPENSSMIATQVASPFLTPFKLSIVTSIFIAVPYILYQIWSFIAPGLYKHEQRIFLPLLISSSLLFYLGAAFAYYVIFPLVFQFFTSISLEGVTQMTDITDYLNFVLKMFVAFGFAFEVPVAIILLSKMGVIDPKTLGEKRPYVIVGSFVVGMLVTPPDIISQVLLAVPVWMLFELGLLVSLWVEKKREDNEEEEA